MLCRHCNQEKPLDAFSKTPTKLGYKRKCKECVAAYYRNYFASRPDQAAAQRARVAENDKVYKRTRYRHGLTESRYQDLMARHNGLCWSCKEEEGRVIDHDHNCCPQTFSCGECVRGILCSGCNTSLGLLKEDVDRIKSLGLYLESTIKGR